ncbi:5-methylthioadenosine/S-adenosylhomocysteine deaminase [Desulfocicer vacuolatum DSM 3385]|uniref:5-methylthioadenosine/S-adenosylhomocysteine deaminase n=1 Tax=Desulfocicer vacuolatum DSM 3385 TaxID=1121400 RepID=A0A1W2B954_9BACT|nr:amidohydrolase [Desulfocicer vacuolatum]SMC69466.1 5-methylthioadenosine/S-adenosylhomocysteine deaminase [Desulfocicer vacuolatum DSM 3385]
MEGHTTAINNAMVITMEPGQPILEQGSILVEGDCIADVRAGSDFSAAPHRDIIDGTNLLVMPGLVNCHTHLPMSLFRGLADDLPLDVWLQEHMFPAEAAQMTPAVAEKWAFHSCGELLLSGTTCCCDGYFYEDHVARGVERSGIRAVLGQGVMDFPAPGVPDPGENIAVAEKFIDKWKDKNPRIHPSVFCHSPYTCCADTLKKAKEMATSQAVLFQIHVAETRNEMALVLSSQGGRASSVVQYLDGLDILDDRTLMVHCVWLDKEDIGIVKARKSSVVHCPESNMKLASGISPVLSFMAAGMDVGLGTDGSASNNNLDLFSEMDMAAKLQKTALDDPCALKAKSVVEMATLGGARALGLDRHIGSLVVGKKADLIAIDLRSPHLVPMYDPFSALVYNARGSDVIHVMVDGVFRIKDRVWGD